ncbi:MAG: hypothetical protein IJ708_02875 [Clostridia bacterium]|nr:hypothetical protein [Clostridia bacterium]
MDVHKEGLELTEGAMERASLRLEAYMFPNRAVTEQEKAVFARAARLQAEHEASVQSDFPALPSEVSGFQIGHFQASLREGMQGRDSLCPLAYGLLLREGLLYRGIEGRGEPIAPAKTEEKVPEVTRPDVGGLPPLRPGVKPIRRDAWLPARKTHGNPPPQGVPPQGEPPLPGLPITGGRRG